MKVSRGTSQAMHQAKSQEADLRINGAKKKAGGMKTPKPDLSAQVNLSRPAQQIKAAREMAGQQTIDEQKVAYFQNLIDSGRYNIDSVQVAEHLVDEHLKMPT